MSNANPYHNTYGLTGIIGSGKSTVSDLLKKKGALVLNADELSRIVLSNEYDRYNAVVDKLKLEFRLNNRKSSDRIQDIFSNKLEINRKALAAFVFTDPRMLQILNEIIHPEVARLFQIKKEGVPADSILIYDVPLLFETNIWRRVYKTIVVYAPEEIAIKRASARLNISVELVKVRLNNQISIKKKRELADYVVDNSSDNLDDLSKEVNLLWNKLNKRK